ncbi:MAG: aspartate carbamoyltransferase [Candidatus Methanomethyliales bacterium]|nr:aspartate carbamoyltransferase [Candidatus Methanomethylicales archaeon]
MNFLNRDVVSIKDFTKDEFEHIFKTAEKMEERGYDSALLRGKKVGLLFYEPSTRTRMSFDAAAHALGAETIWFAGVEGTSVMKGETLKDTIETVANYVDLIVMRHPFDGSARWAADVTTNRAKRGHKKVPIINGGDGKNEHPTQTMLDLYSIRKTQGRIDGLAVAMVGDLKYGRTVHSLSYALSLYNCKLMYVAPDPLQIPEHVEAFLKRKNIDYFKHSKIEDIISIADVIYMTRIQKERFPDENEYNKVKGIFKINRALLSRAKPTTRLMHPLPRVDEISVDCDEDPRAYYFEQAGNGVPVRAALLSLIMGAIE